MTVVDKHGNTYNGFVLGDDWSDAPPPPPPPPPDSPTPVRVSILIAHSINDPLPQALELAKVAARDFQQSNLQLELHFDEASVHALRLVAQRGCDLLFFYGHGSEDRKLIFVDGPKDYAQLSSTIGLEAFWAALWGVVIFACYGDRFAASLPCPWVSFSAPILKDSPKAFVHALVQALETKTIDEALREAKARCREELIHG